MSLFKMKFIHVEAKFSVAELNQIRQHSGDYIDEFVRRFHDKKP